MLVCVRKPIGFSVHVKIQKPIIKSIDWFVLKKSQLIDVSLKIKNKLRLIDGLNFLAVANYLWPEACTIICNFEYAFLTVFRDNKPGPSPRCPASVSEGTIWILDHNSTVQCFVGPLLPTILSKTLHIFMTISKIFSCHIFVTP